MAVDTEADDLLPWSARAVLPCPRRPWGYLDLQRAWTNATAPPLERPHALAGKEMPTWPTREEPYPVGKTDRLPDFIVIGALKCGTTWLDSQLRGHLDLHLPSKIKEVNFFSREYERGLDWYKSFWDVVPSGHHAELRRGEISPTYFVHSGAPERIRRHLPDVRLVAVLREPVRRLYSQYTHWVRATGYADGLETFLVEHRNAVETGFYDVHIQRFLRYFSRDQLKIVIFEEMISNPEDVLRRLRFHLGVPADGPWHVTDTGIVNRSVKPRFPKLSRTARKAARALRSRNADWVVEAAGRFGLGNLLTQGEPFPNMPSAVRETLQREYEPHVKDLESLLGWRIETWRSERV